MPRPSSARSRKAGAPAGAAGAEEAEGAGGVREVGEVDPEAAYRRAMDAALDFLAARARTAQEIHQHLLRKSGFGPEVIERAEARLGELGLIDDAAVARGYLEEAVLRRGQARAKAQTALAQRGIGAEVIDAAAGALGEGGPRAGEGAPAGAGGVGGARGGVFPGGDGAEFDRALGLARSRVKMLHGTEESVRRRLWGYLARRGYEADTVEQVCAAVLGAGEP